MNGDFLNKKIADPKGRVEKLSKAATPLPELVDELYLVTLSRPATAAEATWAQGWVAAAPQRKDGVQDLLWSLLNSREFLFNH
jgi:hypothetical protein